jgi:hypothetical protein
MTPLDCIAFTACLSKLQAPPYGETRSRQQKSPTWADNSLPYPGQSFGIIKTISQASIRLRIEGRVYHTLRKSGLPFLGWLQIRP